jgi:uncharacterized protein
LRTRSSATVSACLLAGKMVETKPSIIHGLGLFATRVLPKGTRVVEYSGEKIDKRESLRRRKKNNHFIFYFDLGHDLDGNLPSNPARFVNHRCSPNCEAEFINGQIWLIAIVDIPAGEEVTFNYGYDLEDYKDFPCHCGSSECAGFMVAEEFIAKVREEQRAGAADQVKAK